MIKLLKLVFVSMFLCLISACSFIVREERTDAYRALKLQYHQYLDYDFMFFENFQSYINVASTETAKSVVKIKVDMVNSQNQVMTSQFGSGVVFDETETSYTILTTHDLIQVIQPNTHRIQVTDYMGSLYTGILVHRDSELELAVISIYKNPNNVLPLIEISTHHPLPNEPILLISYRQKVMNSMVMGFITSIFDGDPVNQMYTSIETDIYSFGGVVLNNHMKLVGINYMLEGNLGVVISLKGIEIYLNQYQMEIYND